MKRLFLLHIFITLFYFTQGFISFAQCDSLAIASEKSIGTEKVDALNEYARCFLGSDFERMDSITTQAQNLAISLNYLNGIARSKQNQGLYLFYYKGKSDEALLRYQHALSIYREDGDSLGAAKSMVDIGSCYQYNQEFGLALNLYINALELCEAENYERGVSAISNNIGSIYSISKDWNQALIYFKKAFALTDSIKDPLNYSIQCSNVTAAFIYLEERDSAELYFNSSINFIKDLNSPAKTSGAYLSMTELYTDAKDSSHPDWYKFKSYSDSAYFYGQKSKSWKDQFPTIIRMGQIAEIEGKLELAKTYYLAVILEYNPENPPNKSMVVAHLKMSKIYAESGNYQLAYTTLSEAYTHKIKLDKAQNIELLEEMGIKYQVKQSKKELDLIKKDKALTDLKLLNAEAENTKKDILAKKKQLQLYAIGIGLFLSLLLGLIALKGYRNKIKSNAIILKQKQEVEFQKEEIEEQHREIKDSITYAKRIQNAILPSNKLVKSYLEKNFILYKPKDIVAGDFYWMEPLSNGILFAAADCTGHGVPGAMVSVVCNNALNRVVREFGLTQPAEILEKTREIVIQEFEKSEEEVKDGMDIAMCALTGNTLHFAGAYNPLWIIRKGATEIEEIKGDKQPIGRFRGASNFRNHTITLNTGDTFYIFSDGFADQFGGEKGKKFKTTNFKKLILSIQHHKIEDHKALLDDVFEKWKGDLEQLDDVCVIGVRL